jgi:hypothetical protein
MSDVAVDQLKHLFARRSPFNYRLIDLGRWPHNLHLLPAPAEPFVALTKAVWEAFPAFPPYEGRYADIVPHLSVAQGGTELLDEAELLLRSRVPTIGISAACTEISLIANTGTTWQEVARFRLGNSAPRTLNVAQS